MPTQGAPPIRNRLLARLQAPDFALLQPHLDFVDLRPGNFLEARNRSIEHVYFPESGLVSVGARLMGERAEVGLIGRDGMTGLAVVLGADRTPQECFVRGVGTALRISTERFRNAMSEIPALRSTALLFAQAFAIQVSFTVSANGCGKLEERLARCLLMAHDRSDSGRLFLTPGSLAEMLGVGRTGVTVAVELLARSGMINVTRGAIEIIDRAGLREESNGTYGEAEKEYERLLG